MKVTQTKTEDGKQALRIEWRFWTEEMQQKRDELVSQGFFLGDDYNVGDTKFAFWVKK